MTIEWLVEFRGKIKKLDEIEAPEFHAIIAGTRQMLERSFAGSEDDLSGLKVTYFAESDEQGWGFKLSGPAYALNLAKDLVGDRRDTHSPKH